MAEFSEVMNTWKRMCESHDYCTECPIGGFDGQIPLVCKSDITQINGEIAKTIEFCIEYWASNNPEPTYPSWVNWLKREGIVADTYGYGSSLSGRIEERTELTQKAREPIPGNIAKKLGIEPE